MTFIRTALAPCLALLLTGCLLVPGQFEAELMITPDGEFAFVYDGEIRVGPDDEQDRSGSGAGDTDVNGEDDGMGAAIDAGMEEAAQIFMGGLNPRDEDSVRAFAEQLQARRGWDRVDYLGAGLFDVDYSVSGRLDRDFFFPVVQDFLLNFPMVAAVPLDDGSVRVTVPALMPPPSQPSSGDATREEEEGPLGSGTFTLRTTAEIVSTNGAVSSGELPGETVIRWSSDDPPEERPEAIIRLEP
ncbi:hypothetical protein [Parasphingopyxis sp.]|uniref:hypothetical protein n=1 Tax=Parasphingopyxis sp. TaxID=1920299 RepID=UPI002612F600|nr:hypothetical protein [Parasphingopyxis sp.]